MDTGLSWLVKEAVKIRRGQSWNWSVFGDGCFKDFETNFEKMHKSINSRLF